MAERPVNGKDVLLFIDSAGGTDYDLIVCLTSNSKNIATSVIDSASKCGPSSSAGPTTVSVDFAGQIMADPDTGHISEGDLHDLIIAGTTVGWMMGPEDPEDEDDIYSGTGFFSSLNSVWDMNGATFSGTLSPDGTPSHTRFGES